MAGQASSLQLELGYMREDRPVTACCCLLGWTGQRGNWAGLGTRRCSSKRTRTSSSNLQSGVDTDESDARENAAALPSPETRLDLVSPARALPERRLVC